MALVNWSASIGGLWANFLPVRDVCEDWRCEFSSLLVGRLAMSAGSTGNRNILIEAVMSSMATSLSWFRSLTSSFPAVFSVWSESFMPSLALVGVWLLSSSPFGVPSIMVMSPVDAGGLCLPWSLASFCPVPCVFLFGYGWLTSLKRARSSGVGCDLGSLAGF